MHDLAVHGKRFYGHVGHPQDRAPWRLVHPSGLHSHKPVFHQIDPPYAVSTSEHI